MAKLELQSQPMFSTKFGLLDVVGAFCVTLASRISAGIAQASELLRSFFAAGH